MLSLLITRKKVEISNDYLREFEMLDDKNVGYIYIEDIKNKLSKDEDIF